MIGNAIQLLQLAGLVLIAFIVQELHELKTNDRSAVQEKPDLARQQRIAWIDGPGHEPLDTYMKHIREAFEQRGYKIIVGPQRNGVEWDAMWIHDYSLGSGRSNIYKSHIEKSTPNQVINHVPGSGYYSRKVSLATCASCLGVPQAFSLPEQKEAFLKAAKENPDNLWVQKDNAHRNIQIKPVAELDLTKSDSFIQRFVDKPLLVDNRKFDIGIYTVVTSLQPLKVYIYNGDVLLRFCAHDYYPFDANDVDKYVVGDDYTPIWEIPSLSKFYNEQKLGRRATLDAYLKSKGQDPMKIWTQIGAIIAQVFQSQQEKMLEAARTISFRAQMFELSRFDFIVDEELNVYLMEANMSPNLSSGHFKQNQILYEQVLHSIFSLVGLSSSLTKITEQGIRDRSKDAQIFATDRDVAVSLNRCLHACKKCDEEPECQLCGHCMTESTLKMLRSAYQEHMNRQHMIRVQFDCKKKGPLTREDLLLQTWYRQKCSEDYLWC